MHSDYRVSPRIVPRRAVKHVDADTVFLYIVLLTCDRSLDNKAQKTPKAIGAGESPAAQDRLKVLKNFLAGHL